MHLKRLPALRCSGFEDKNRVRVNFRNQPDADSGVQGPAGGPKYSWQYDENQARIKEIQTIASGTMAGTRTTWRAHPDNAGGLSFEHEDNAPAVPTAANPDVDQSRHYLSVGGQTMAVFVTIDRFCCSTGAPATDVRTTWDSCISTVVPRKARPEPTMRISLAQCRSSASLKSFDFCRKER